jgi:large subunit ribosomal protein L21
MYAVIETGGKQYRVEVGTELEVELLDVEPGKTITLDRVLLVADGADASIGRPLVDGAAVSAEVLRRDRGDKVIAFKYRPKARRRVKKGHRQELTVLRISDIVLDGKSAAKAAAKAESDAKTERQRLEEAASAQAARDAELAAKLAAKTPAKAADTKKPAKASAKAEATPGKAAAS